MAELEPGAVFAGHRIQAVAGRGGMGVVYRATQLDLDRLVALKLIAPQLAQDEDFRDRFVRESRAAASIDHPNVIPIYYSGEAEDQLYIAMRYVEGDDLRTLIRQEGRLAPTRAARIVAQVGSALDAAHARGIVHRDVKPANVLLAAGNHAYLTDFGLTKRLQSHLTAATHPGGWVGTLGYVSPEQIRGEPVDARADVYALGCVLFHSLTGAAPYQRDSDEATLWAHLHDPPPPVTDAAPSVPAAFEDVIGRALAKDPGDRYMSTGDLGRAALAAAGIGALEPERLVAKGAAAPVDESTQGSPEDDRTAVAPPVARPPGPRDRRYQAVFAVLVVAAASIAAFLALSGGGEDGAKRSTAPTGSARLSATTPIGRRGTDIAHAPGKVWITSFTTGELLGLDDQTNAQTAVALPEETGAAAIDAGFGALWVANSRTQTVTRIDAQTRQHSEPIKLPPGQAVAVAAGERAVWVGSRTGGQNPFTVKNVVRINPATNKIVRELTLPNGVQDLAVGAGAVWVLNRTKRAVTRINVRTGERANAVVGRDPQRVAVGAGFVWVTNGADDTVTRIDPETLQTSTIGVGRQPVGVGVGGGAVWVANRVDSTLTRIDPDSAQPVGDPLPAALNPTALTVHGHRVWVVTPGNLGVVRIDFS